MTSIYDVLKASKGIHVDDTFAELWGRKLSNAYSVATYTGTLPATLQTVGGYLESYKIYGSTVQDGTPTPENPIMPSGCGERTENLAFTGWAEDFVKRAPPDKAYKTQVDGRNCLYVYCTVGYDKYDTEYMFKTDFKESTMYTLSFEYMRPSNLNSSNTICVLYTDGTKVPLPNYINDGDWHKRTFTTAPGKTVKSICSYYTSGYVYIDIDTFMVVEGSTALPYEPYGYKLPLTVNGVEYPIYLGEVETTRRIKKLVLTGEEDTWTMSGSINNTYFFNVHDYFRKRINITICSHYSSQDNITGAANMQNCHASFYANLTQPTNALYIRDDNLITLANFKSYLQQQYVAGTPVTVWYVLAEPETGIVNEPLMQIGDYADTVSMEQAGVSIPTAPGETTISWAGEGLAPSEVELTYRKPKGQ